MPIKKIKRAQENNIKIGNVSIIKTKFETYLIVIEKKKGESYLKGFPVSKEVLELNNQEIDNLKSAINYIYGYEKT